VLGFGSAFTPLMKLEGVLDVVARGSIIPANTVGWEGCFRDPTMVPYYNVCLGILWECEIGLRIDIRNIEY